MSLWQLLTIATLLVAAAILGASALLGWRIAYDQSFVDWLVEAGWLGIDKSDDRGVIALLVVLLAFGAAAGLVQFQQRCVGWSVDREMRRLRDIYHDVEMALGTEAAQVFLEYKANQMTARSASLKGMGAVFG